MLHVFGECRPVITLKIKYYFAFVITFCIKVFELLTVHLKEILQSPVIEGPVVCIALWDTVCEVFSVLNMY